VVAGVGAVGVNEIMAVAPAGIPEIFPGRVEIGGRQRPDGAEEEEQGQR
jgi:hypothetical protein